MATPNQAKSAWAENTTQSALETGLNNSSADTYENGANGNGGVNNSSNQDYMDGVEDFLGRTGGTDISVNQNYEWQENASGSGSDWLANARANVDKYVENTGEDKADDWLQNYSAAYE